MNISKMKDQEYMKKQINAIDNERLYLIIEDLLDKDEAILSLRRVINVICENNNNFVKDFVRPLMNEIIELRKENQE